MAFVYTQAFVDHSKCNWVNTDKGCGSTYHICMCRCTAVYSTITRIYNYPRFAMLINDFYLLTIISFLRGSDKIRTIANLFICFLIAVHLFAHSCAPFITDLLYMGIQK